ncbi:phospholipase effector Tle1 domain-containing protein [Vibrio aerogenes]|uniref:phospholipase effector Tle1 domain-containing protein n=1 Tax=Vibrio aerogenes TaxID=92172 RepID=UPI0039EFBAD6
MSATGAGSHCTTCEKYDHWIELVVVDEHNQSFDTVKGTLTDGSGKKHDIEISDQPLLVEGLAPGRITLSLQKKPWLKQAQARTPNQADDDPVQQWLDENPTGHEASERQLQNATMGDLVSKGKTQKTLPERHRAGQAGTLKLATDNSYVVKIQGANYITLRLGMFFDGTANNTYSANWGKKKLDAYAGTWRGYYLANQDKPFKDWPAESLEFPNDDDFHWFWQKDEDVESSAANEWTNVQKLYDLYMEKAFNDDNSVFYHKEYITGIGTGNSTEIAKADESTLGQGLGTGDYGVTAKVSTGIKQLCEQIPDLFKFIKERSPELVDGITKFEFDAFGFSRGAAAARHFIHTVLDGKKSQFAKKLRKTCQKEQIFLTPVFDWKNNEQCEVTFAGIFDTVAAIAQMNHFDFTPHNTRNGKVRLWLDPKRVKHAVHLTASSQTEYRYNFCLNRFNPAKNFHELSLPGAHSDIGGGYFSRQSFEPDFLLPLFEHKQIAQKTQIIDDDWFSEREYQRVKAKLTEKLQKTYQMEAEAGWNMADYQIRFKKQKRKRGNSDRRTEWKITGELYIQRIVEGDLSRLYLRVMYGLAEFYGVPVSDINENNYPVWTDPDELYYTVPDTLLNSVTKEKYPYGKLCQEILQMAKSGDMNTLSNSLSHQSFQQKMMQLNLIHHSSSTGIANPPNLKHGHYEREVFACNKND